MTRTQGPDNLPRPTDADADGQESRSGDIADKCDFHDVEDAALVRQTLRTIMADPSAPAAAKAQAARTLAEMAQLLGRHQREASDPTAPVQELTRAAMLAELEAIEGAG